MQGKCKNEEILYVLAVSMVWNQSGGSISGAL
jgi:hypothetical protein